MAKRKPKHDNKEQSERFIEKAREITSDDAAEAFDRALEEVIPPARPKDQSS
jgi:hypothetical protein